MKFNFSGTYDGRSTLIAEFSALFALSNVNETIFFKTFPSSTVLTGIIVGGVSYGSDTDD